MTAISELLTAVAELLKDDFDEKALFEQAARREYENSSCWMLDKMDDTLSMYELPMGLYTENSQSCCNYNIQWRMKSL